MWPLKSGFELLVAFYLQIRYNIIRMRTKVELSVLFHEMARRLLLKQDLATVANGMRMPLKTVQELTRRGDFKEVLESLRDDTYQETDRALKEEARNITQEIQRAAEESFDLLQELMASVRTGAGHRIKIAQDMLDRAGHRAKDDHERVVVNINNIDAQVLAETMRAEQEARQRLSSASNLVTQASEFQHPTDLKRGTNTSESADRGSRAEGT